MSIQAAEISTDSPKKRFSPRTVRVIFPIVVLGGVLVGFWKYQRDANESEILNKALITAVLNDNADEVHRLLEHGADPNTRFGAEPESLFTRIGRLLHLTHPNPIGEPILINAFARPNRQSAILLLEHGADPNARQGGDPMLYQAVLGNDPEKVRILLSHGADPNLTTSNHMTPLMMAASDQNAAVARILLDHHADTSLRSDDGLTALDHAVRSKANNVARLLREWARDKKPVR